MGIYITNQLAVSGSPGFGLTRMSTEYPVAQTHLEIWRVWSGYVNVTVCVQITVNSVCVCVCVCVCVVLVVIVCMSRRVWQ